MRIWTLVFFSVASIVALLGGAGSWDTLWVAARVVVLIAMAVVLLAAIRGIVLRRVRPWDEGAGRHVPRTRARERERVRRPHSNVGRVARLAGSHRERLHPLASSRTTRSVGERSTL